jgi:transposase-like protein
MIMTTAVNKEQPVRSRRSFTDEFKTDAVALVIDEGRKISDVADSLGIGAGTLGNWVRQARIDRGETAGLTTSEKAELVELRRENARLRMERDLLKRATAFWVKESGQ